MPHLEAVPATLTLVLETSTPHASIALAGAEGVLEQRGFCSDRNHNALLFAPLRELLQARPNRAIRLVLVGSGPGSYSGTRVGIAAAQGVAIALACPAVAVPSVLAVAAAARGAACLAIGDARRGSFWSVRMDQCRLIGVPTLCDAYELSALVARACAEGLTVFSFENPARFPLPGELAEQVQAGVPEASRLWQAWEQSDPLTRRQWCDAVPQPIYLKPPHITPAKPPDWRKP